MAKKYLKDQIPPGDSSVVPTENQTPAEREAALQELYLKNQRLLHEPPSQPSTPLAPASTLRPRKKNYGPKPPHS